MREARDRAGRRHVASLRAVSRSDGRGGMSGRLLTLREVGDALGCSVATVKRRIRSGALPAFVDGRLVRVREADLTRYIAERTVRRSDGRPSTVAAGRTLAPGSRLWD